MSKPTSVSTFLAALKHGRKSEVEFLRAAVLNSDPAISEQIKWNAPSFCWRGEDRVTMRLQPNDRIQLIFHRGVKPKETQGFKFEDPTGLIEWATVDRGVVTISDKSMLSKRMMELVALIKDWMVATD